MSLLMQYIPYKTGTSRPRPRASLIDVAYHAKCMNAHICRWVPNIIVMRSLETRNSRLPRKKKTGDVTESQGKPDVRPARSYPRRTPLALLDLFQIADFKRQALHRRPMFVLPSHFSPCTLSIHRPIVRQPGKPARTSPDET